MRNTDASHSLYSGIAMAYYPDANDALYSGIAMRYYLDASHSLYSGEATSPAKLLSF